MGLEQLQEGIGRKRLRTEDAGARPDLGVDQLESGQRVDRRLPHDRLRPVLRHGGGVVDHVVEVHLTRLAVLPGAADQSARAGQAGHALTEAGGIRQACGDHIARRDPGVADLHRGGLVQTQLVQGLENADELVAQAVLEGDPAAVDPAWHQEDLLVLHVHALDRADARGKVEDLGLAEGRRRVPAAPALVDDRRVEAFLDRRPDREGGGELVSLDDQVGSVADTHLVDGGEEVIGGVPREDVGEAGLHAHPHQGQEPLALPFTREGELLVTELDTRRGEGVVRVGAGE